MEYDLTNPSDATQAANKPELTKEFIPSLGITEIPDFETFSLDPDKYLSQVTEPEGEGIEEPTQEVEPVQNETQDEETLPPADETTQEESTDMPGAEDAPEGGAETAPEETQEETLQ